MSILVEADQLILEVFKRSIIGPIGEKDAVESKETKNVEKEIMENRSEYHNERIMIKHS